MSVHGGCLIGTIGVVATVAREIAQLCEGRSAAIGPRGESVEATYASYVRGLLEEAPGTDSIVCVELRCRARRLGGLRLVVLPDSLINAYVDTRGSTVEVLITTGLLDVTTATSATLGHDVARIICFPAILGPRSDCARQRWTRADTGVLPWLNTLRAHNGGACDHVPRYPYPFASADSGMITQAGAASIVSTILAHEFAHMESDSARCGAVDQTDFGVEAACDSVAINVHVRQGSTPVFPIGLYVVMGHLERIFAPVFTSLATAASDPAKYREIRDWHRRAAIMMTAWRADAASSKKFAKLQQFTDSLLAVTLPEACDAAKGRPMWAGPPPRRPERAITRDEARSSVARMGYTLDAKTFRTVIGEGSLSTVKLFLQAGLDPNVTDGADPVVVALFDRGWLCLGCAQAKERAATLDTLLEAGLNPNSRSGRGQTLLMLAPDIAYMRVLLKHRADVHLADPDGFTALMHAVQRRDTNATRVLLEAGSRINAFDAGHFGPRRTALMYGRRDPAIAELLLRHGADANLADSAGWTPLLLAVRDQDVIVVRLLLAHRADPNRHSPYGRSALEMAIASGNREVVTALRRAGARE